ncbi:MAG: sulfur oxidation c-type cytochrome SoxA [Ramlibacter sp.]
MIGHARLAAAAMLATLLGCSTPTATDTRRSGYEDMGAPTQAIQRDDGANPGMLWVKDGELLWNTPTGPRPSCAGCHGAAATTMRGVAARYPAWDTGLARPVNLGTRINLCRQRHQQLTAMASDDAHLLSLEAYVGHQSRGMPITPDPDPRLAPARARGAERFAQRIGQLDLSCAQCHDQNAGGRLAASLIPQAHPTGYPLYRLEWQALGSLQRRLRGCMTGVRAEPFAAGSLEMVELELHLATRAMGMALETPAVRP